MRVFIVHAHPEPMSFSGALTRTATAALADAGHEVVVSDLYAIGFNPVSGRHNFTTVSDPDYYRQQPKRPTPRRMTDLRQSFNARWITCSGATRWLCNFRCGGSACRPSSRAGLTEFSPSAGAFMAAANGTTGASSRENGRCWRLRSEDPRQCIRARIE